MSADPDELSRLETWRASAPRIRQAQEGPCGSRATVSIERQRRSAAAFSATIETLPNPDSAGECEDVALKQSRQISFTQGF
jgi:hypothetical protein